MLMDILTMSKQKHEEGLNNKVLGDMRRELMTCKKLVPRESS